ncbi:hypothetical protein KAZ93_00470 [Patescibacteria group bacterium]|nr:hypothetical protein [Patescibacteria group bacterium]
MSDEEKEKAQEAEAKKRKEGGKNTFNTPRYTLPKTTTLQTYVEMKKNPKTKTYPQYAEWLFAQA